MSEMKIKFCPPMHIRGKLIIYISRMCNQVICIYLFFHTCIYIILIEKNIICTRQSELCLTKNLPDLEYTNIDASFSFVLSVFTSILFKQKKKCNQYTLYNFMNFNTFTFSFKKVLSRV